MIRDFEIANIPKRYRLLDLKILSDFEFLRLEMIFEISFLKA